MTFDVDALQELDGEENVELGGCLYTCVATCRVTSQQTLQ
ncbi:ALQxL family class IV lanthipeptide [Streptomyces sp. NPDC005438]